MRTYVNNVSLKYLFFMKLKLIITSKFIFNINCLKNVSGVSRSGLVFLITILILIITSSLGCNPQFMESQYI